MTDQILIVEDSLTQALELQIILEGANYACVIARDGLEGVQKFSSQRFDLVLTDIQMPGMSGYDLTRAIKARNASVPVILLTSLSGAKDIMLGLECGADNFVTKPYDADYLLKRVQQSLSNKVMRANKGAEGVDVVFQNETYSIKGESEQLVDFLVSTFEDYLRARQREAEARLSETEQRLKAETLSVQEELKRKAQETELATESARVLALKAEELRLSEERFNLAIEGSHDGIWDWDLVNKTCFYSDKCKQQLGYDPRELDNDLDELAGLVHPDDKQRLDDAVKNHLENRIPYDIEYRVKTRSGPYKWIHSRGQAIWNEQGKALRIAGSHRDITQRREYEQRLAESEAHVKALFSGMSDGVYQIDEEGRVVYLNPSAERILGYKAKDLINHNMHELVCHSLPDTNPAECPLLQVVKTGENYHADTDQFITATGEHIPVEYSGSPVYRVGKIVGAVVTFRDITERREAEKRVREFYSTVSHELRTPLTSIRGSLGLIEGGLVGEITAKTLQFIQIARVESDRLIRLINDILDISKIEAGKLDLKIRELLPATLVSTTVQSMNGFAEQNKVTLESEIRAESAIQGDSDRLTQVLTNLISNAVKFSPDGGIVKVRLLKSNDDQMRFEVQDQGPGIPREKQHLLFGKFQQIDSTDTRKKGGTGLGLAVSKAIVEQHNGKIGFDSSDKGSTFWFEIPVARATDHVKARTGAYPSLIDGNSDTEILVADSDVATREVLVQQLRNQNYICHAAKNGADALAQADKKNVIVVELTLDDMSGFAFIEKLRKKKPTQPVLVYTSQDLSAEEIQMLDSNITKCLIKSKASPRDIINSINFLLKA
jgi:PAS domain S-box-containing protein